MSGTSDRPTDAGISIFSTLEAFKSGLTSTLSRSGAADVCRGWVAKIDDSNRPDLHGIRDGLVRLARQLDDSEVEAPASADAIGATMVSLGAHTAEASRTIDHAHLEDPLRRLGAYLQAAGKALQGGSRPDTIQGVSTDIIATAGDPTLRTVNAAPDRSV
ncbi:MAG: hypothetical protein AAGK21_04540 [Bacteroidota bacterium]